MPGAIQLRAARPLIGLLCLGSVAPTRRMAPQAKPALAIELQLSDRWHDGKEPARFKTFVRDRQWSFIDSVRQRSADSPRGAARTLYMTNGRRDNADRASIAVDSAGRLVRLDAWRPFLRSPANTDMWSVHVSRIDLADESERLALKGRRAWDFVHPFHPRRLARGEQWRDTLRFAAEEKDDRQTLVGTRVSMLMGDTVVDGRRLWIVADSAQVSYEQRALDVEYTLDTLVTIDRAAAGYVRGRMLYDPGMGFFRTRDDSAVLVGHATLRYPDGRHFDVPTRYEAQQHWSVYDSAGYTRRLDDLRAEDQRRRSPGEVRVPVNGVDTRLAPGDTAARDSLLRLWERSSDPDDGQRMFSRLTALRAADPAFVARLDTLRIDVAGDTTFMLESLASKAFERKPRNGIDTATMRQLILVMANPGLSFAWGVDRDRDYEDLAQQLVLNPPAVVRDTAAWPCTPAACRMLAAQWPGAAEPRLRQVALVARFVLDPRHWIDTLEANAGRRPPLLADAVRLARAVVGPGADTSVIPMPATGADWRAWFEWLAGRTPDPEFEFEGSHAAAIRLVEVVTGRDITRELRDQLAMASSDSAHLVFEYMLVARGAFHPPPASVAAYFGSGSPALVTLGEHEVPFLFGRRAPPADSATTNVILDRLIAMYVAHEPPWRRFDPLGRLEPMASSSPPPREDANQHTLLRAESVPPSLRGEWSARVAMVTTQEWEHTSVRTGAILLTLSTVERIGQFVRVSIQGDGRGFMRATFYLVLLNGEWVIVGDEMAVS